MWVTCNVCNRLCREGLDWLRVLLLVFGKSSIRRPVPAFLQQMQMNAFCATGHLLKIAKLVVSISWQRHSLCSFVHCK